MGGFILEWGIEHRNYSNIGTTHGYKVSSGRLLNSASGALMCGIAQNYHNKQGQHIFVNAVLSIIQVAFGELDEVVKIEHCDFSYTRTCSGVQKTCHNIQCENV